MKSRVLKINALLVSSLVSVIIGVVISLLVPKILANGTIENPEYAQYRKYLFYLPFLCIFHIGFVNGTFVRISNTKNLSLDELKKQYIGSFYIYFILQLIFTLAFGLVDFFILHQQFKWIVISLFFYNIEAFFVKLLNARLNVYALSIYEIFNKIFILTAVLLMMFGVMPKVARLLIIFNVVMHVVVAIALFVFFRKIMFCKFSFKESVVQFVSSIKIGLPLLISYFVVLLIVGATSIIIEYDFEIDYSNYQFVYSLMGLVTGLLSYFNGLILPSLNKLNEESIEHYYHFLMTIVFIFAGLLFCLSPVINPVLQAFFQEYSGSYYMFVFSIPTLCFFIFYYSIFYCFYQFKYYQRRLMIINIVSAVITVGLLKLASFLFNNSMAVLFSYIVLLLCWFIALSFGLVWKDKKRIVFEIIAAAFLVGFSPLIWSLTGSKAWLFIIVSLLLGSIMMAPNVYLFIVFLKKRKYEPVS